jgi:hypothetical protein
VNVNFPNLESSRAKQKAAKKVEQKAAKEAKRERDWVFAVNVWQVLLRTWFAAVPKKRMKPQITPSSQMIVTMGWS